jgi:hypothetical protein
VAQPELEMKWKKFSITFTANLNYRPKHLQAEFYKKKVIYDEQDIEIGYTTSRKKFDFEFKAMAYLYFYQIGAPNTAELSHKIIFNLTDQFSIFTENSIDFISYKGAFYNNTGISYSKDFRHKFKLELNGYTGIGNTKFNSSYFDTETGGFNLIGSTLEFTKEIGVFYITASGEINKYMNKAIKNATQLNHTDNFGMAVGINF